MKLARFMKQCEQRLNLRLSCYRGGNVERSITRMMDKFDCFRLDQLLVELEGDKQRRQEFIDCLAINVTDFFRDPKQFRYLRYSVLPKLLKRRRSVRIWSAGCSAGQEAYSLAMLLEELDPDRTARIVGTDINMATLTQARMGVYDKKEAEGLSAVRRRSFLMRQDKHYKVCDAVADRVTFRRHDLLTGRFPQNYYDLIVFRNVAIHFERDASRALHGQFFEALRNGGILFLGGAERLFYPERFGLRQMSHCCYVKEEVEMLSENQRRLAG